MKVIQIYQDEQNDWNFALNNSLYDYELPHKCGKTVQDLFQ